MNKHDTKIAQLQTKVAQQKKELGSRPRYTLVTNGLLNNRNINTVSKEDAVMLYAAVLRDDQFVKQSCKELGVSVSDVQTKVAGYLPEEWKKDFTNRIATLDWLEKNKKLTRTEAVLKELMSKDARTASALAEIEAQL